MRQGEAAAAVAATYDEGVVIEGPGSEGGSLIRNSVIRAQGFLLTCYLQNIKRFLISQY